ncbi:MAG: sigma-70 family RNA polymerase sigma factor [Acidobacteriota bacterium]
METDSDLTELLRQWSGGDRQAAQEAFPQIYQELRRLARSVFRRERSDHTLQATAIVHEAYIQLVEQGGIVWRSRSHFVGLAAHVMRRILVDHARQRGRLKRGGQAMRVTLAEAQVLGMPSAPDVIAVDDALTSLARIDPRKASIVELRFFGGLTADESAQLLGVSSATINREWRKARAWLFREIRRPSPGGLTES